jgi:hypothetical protein
MFLGYNISNVGETYLYVKIINIFKILRIINKIFRASLVCRHPSVRICKVADHRYLIVVIHGKWEELVREE